MLFKISAALCALLAAGAASATCFTAYSNNQLVYESTDSPVDLSRPLSETVPVRFGPGASLVFASDAPTCSNRGDIRASNSAQATDAHYKQLAASSGQLAGHTQAQAAGSAIALDNVFTGPRYKAARRGIP